MYKKKEIENCVHKLEMLINDESLNSKLGKASGKYYEKFEIEYIMQQWDSILEKRIEKC